MQVEAVFCRGLGGQQFVIPGAAEVGFVLLVADVQPLLPLADDRLGVVRRRVVLHEYLEALEGLGRDRGQAFSDVATVVVGRNQYVNPMRGPVGLPGHAALPMCASPNESPLAPVLTDSGR